MTRSDAIQFLCRIPIGTPVVLDTSDADGGDELNGFVGYFAGLGLRSGADTIKLTAGARVTGPREAAVASAQPVDQVDLDEVRRVSIQLTTVRRGSLV